MLLLLGSCTKETRNEKKLEGIWSLDRIETIVYSDNQVISTTDTSFTATMTLTYKKSDLYNDAVFDGWMPFPYSQMNWNVSERQLRIINFHTDGMSSASLYAASLNVEKATSSKLNLSYYISDNNLNVLQKTTWYFKK